ncbi:sensor domain-containing diguanylate cyclase [Propionivibrio dicarboxylicus]|uniref:diguanylate cyclase n=1 Tax=Propionivibrio dicarboxylicus TaxID=83767 RepID=A0A1G8EQU7_9RHOO|nr:sensor domain-containing diguanylate cyclase [Propionivibrio dicarboxylicus]SDH72197.1 PAS domain S-box-containing protein/diguanylate cyclase (GGDEF) domain-containing protein [Propionivibrio dicarboxylicus]
MSRINLDLQASHKMLMLLDEANANTESVIDLMPGIFLVLNENHEVLRANQGFLELFGFDAEDIFRAPLARFFRKENWSVFAHNIRQVVEASEPYPMLRFEMGLSTKAGETESPFHWTLTRRIVKNQGEGRLVMVFGDDISGLREAERRLSRVFTSIPLGIFTIDGNAQISDTYSSYLESMLGQGALAGECIEDVLFGPAMATMSPEAVAGVLAIRECLGRSELTYGNYLRVFPKEIYHDPDPSVREGRWLRITYQPIVFDGFVDQMLVILEDRTAIVNAEREMLDAAREREKSQALERQSMEFYERAIRDPLTGLYTRLYMKDAVAALLWSHDREQIHEASMVIFDIDHFKRVNDTYGHKSGDVILASVGQKILELCPEQAIPIRLGGEELAVFTPHGLVETLALAESIRRSIESMVCALGGESICVTVSGGVAEHIRGESVDDLMQRADGLLYAAKADGRNRISADVEMAGLI